MNRETKAGLVVTASFVGLLSAVIIKKYMEPTPTKEAAAETVVAAVDQKNTADTGGIVPVVTAANMELLPVPGNEIKLTTAEENKGSPTIEPSTIPGVPAIPPVPDLAGKSGGLPPLPGENTKTELPPLPGSAPTIPPIAPPVAPPPPPISGGIPPLPSTPASGIPAIAPPPPPAPIGTPVPAPLSVPGLPSSGTPEPIAPPPAPVAPPIPMGLPAVPAIAPISPPLNGGGIPPLNGGGLPPLPGNSIPLSPSAGTITAPPPPPAAPGFGAGSPPPLNSTSPMPPVRLSNAIPFNANEGPARRTEFIPADPSNRVAPVNNPAGNNGSYIAPVAPYGSPSSVPQKPLGANEIISAPPINGTNPGAGAVLTIPSNNSSPIMPVPPPGTVSSASNQLYTPAAVTPVAPVTAALGAPRVESWTEQAYLCQPGETYASISQKIYGNADYAKALQMWNENHPRARIDAPKSGLLLPGQEVYYPPTQELSRRYGNFMPKVSPVGATGANTQNGVQRAN